MNEVYIVMESYYDGGAGHWETIRNIYDDYHKAFVAAEELQAKEGYDGNNGGDERLFFVKKHEVL